jgi:ribosomal protein L11 methylase PrmA
MGDLKNLLKPDGKLVLSGILDEKKPIVLNAIEQHKLKIIDTIQQDQWICFIVEK